MSQRHSPHLYNTLGVTMNTFTEEAVYNYRKTMDYIIQGMFDDGDPDAEEFAAIANYATHLLFEDTVNQTSGLND